MARLLHDDIIGPLGDVTVTGPLRDDVTVSPVRHPLCRDVILLVRVTEPRRADDVTRRRQEQMM